MTEQSFQITEAEALHQTKRALYGTFHRGSLALSEILKDSESLISFSICVEHINDKTGDFVPTGIESTIWTNGKAIHYTPKFAEKTLYTQQALVVKTLFKIALCHIQRARAMNAALADNFDDRLYTLSSDLVINQTLKGHKKMDNLKPTLEEVIDRYTQWRTALNKPLSKKLPPAIEWNVEQSYYFVSEWRREMKEHPETLEATTRELNWLEKALSEIAPDLDWFSRDSLGNGTMADQLDRDVQDIANWTQRFTAAQSDDKENGMLRRIRGDLPKVNTPWGKVVRAATHRAISKSSKDDWSRAGRGFIQRMALNPGIVQAFEPNRKKDKSSPRIFLAIDSSGSMRDNVLRIISAEASSMQRAWKTEIRIGVGDERVHEIVDVTPNQIYDVCRKVQFKGGHGTDFRPLFEEAEKWKPDVIIFMTDLYGTFPKRAPKCKVIWGVMPEVGRNKYEIPWGQLVLLE